MTLSELLDCDAAKLEAMSDAELTEYFKPFFHVTRPEQAPRRAPSAAEAAIPAAEQAKFRQMEALGIDVKSLKRKFFKKP